MPTFGLKETDLEGDMFEDGSDAYFRRFIAPSMAFLRKKKIFRDHAENIELFNEIEDRKASARDRAYLKFEEARRKHDAKFSNKEQTPSQFASSHISDKEQENIIESWRRVSIHPSSTASINVHGVVGQSMLCENESEAAPSTSNALHHGVLSESTTNLNSSIPSHLYDSSHDASSFFNTSSVFGDSPAHSALPQQKRTFNLDVYSGARPSFVGATASTPISKALFPTSGHKIDPILEQSSIAPASPANTSVFLSSKPSPIQKAPPPVVQSLPIGKPDTVSTTSLATENRTDEAKTQPAKEEKKIAPVPRQPEVLKPLVPETKVLPAKLIPEVQSEGKTDQEQSVPGPKTTATSSLSAFFSSEWDQKEDNDLGSARFEKGTQQQLRSLMKRTIIDRFSLCSKKLASTEEVVKTAIFLRDLFNGQEVGGLNNQKIRAADGDAIQYARSCVADHCLGVVERDLALIPVISQILRTLCNADRSFEAVLVGKLLAASPLLTMDTQQCDKFAAELVGLPSSDRTFTMNKQKSIIKLFCSLHVVGCPEVGSVFTLASLWKCLAFVLNASHRVLGTVIVLNMILETGSDMMSRLYGRQWRKIVSLVNREILPSLEKGLLTDDVRRIAGEALYISVLRNTLETM